MARLEISSISKKKSVTHGGKDKHPHFGRGEKFLDEHQHKQGMDAYYRPRFRGIIDACLREADETEAGGDA